jgi:hypothetical protein
MFKKITINFLAVTVILLLSGALGIVLYYYYFSETSPIFDITLTFFLVSIYSNLFSNIYLFFWKQNFNK